MYVCVWACVCVQFFFHIIFPSIYLYTFSSVQFATYIEQTSNEPKIIKVARAKSVERQVAQRGRLLTASKEREQRERWPATARNGNSHRYVCRRATKQLPHYFDCSLCFCQLSFMWLCGALTCMPTCVNVSRLQTPQAPYPFYAIQGRCNLSR